MNYKIKKLQSHLIYLDTLIKEGKATEVIAYFYKINTRKIPRPLISDYADIARRIGKPHLIIRLLSPFIHDKRLNITPPTLYEKGLYALGLFRLGAFNEAERMLNQINLKHEPRILFFKASMYLNQWRYKEAIPLLNAYINAPEISSYQKLIARLNLCAAHLFIQDMRKAHEFIKSLEEDLSKTTYYLLQGNLMEIYGQFWFENRDFSLAHECLNRSIELLRRADVKTQLHVRKWKSILLLEHDSNDTNALKSLVSVQKSARKIMDWESIRSIDLKIAILQNDPVLLKRVYWGTKFKQYKRNVEKYIDFKQKIDNNQNLMKTLDLKSSTFIWEHPYKKNSSQDSNDSFPIIDLVSMAPTILLQRFLFILASEFYRPLRISEISDELYPHEFYNEISTPIKIHQLVKRTRIWIKKNNLPLKLKLIDHGYQIKFTAPCRLLLHLNINIQKPTDKLVNNINSLPLVFSISDYSDINNIPIRTARYHVSLLLKEQIIKKLDNKKIPLYRVVSNKVKIR